MSGNGQPRVRTCGADGAPPVGPLGPTQLQAAESWPWIRCEDYLWLRGGVSWTGYFQKMSVTPQRAWRVHSGHADRVAIYVSRPVSKGTFFHTLAGQVLQRLQSLAGPVPHCITSGLAPTAPSRSIRHPVNTRARFLRDSSANTNKEVPEFRPSSIN